MNRLSKELTFMAETASSSFPAPIAAICIFGTRRYSTYLIFIIFLTIDSRACQLPVSRRNRAQSRSSECPWARKIDTAARHIRPWFWNKALVSVRTSFSWRLILLKASITDHFPDSDRVAEIKEKMTENIISGGANRRSRFSFLDRLRLLEYMVHLNVLFLSFIEISD